MNNLKTSIIHAIIANQGIKDWSNNSIIADADKMYRNIMEKSISYYEEAIISTPHSHKTLTKFLDEKVIYTDKHIELYSVSYIIEKGIGVGINEDYIDIESGFDPCLFYNQPILHYIEVFVDDEEVTSIGPYINPEKLELDLTEIKNTLKLNPEQILTNHIWIPQEYRSTVPASALPLNY